MTDWRILDIPTVLQRSGTTLDCGLKTGDVARRQQHYGLNQLIERPPKSLGRMLWEQLTATTVLVLIAAAAIAAVLGDHKDTIAILAIVIFNAGLGLNQEYQASQAFAALQQLAVPLAKVCRDGEWRSISARQLVPGDLIRLEAGDFVPADGRLIESANLQVQESAFTGEFAPVDKDSQRLAPKDLSLGDRQNMVYLGTVVTYGRGQVVVTATGMTTELGQIAQAVQTLVPEPTPLQKRLDSLGKRLAIATLLLVLVILGLGLFRGENFYMMVLTAVSIAVAVIPEGLPAVVTITLALGARRMLNRQALIRKLPAVETLGSVTTICADKTGTLTENRMTVVVLEVAGQQLDLRHQPWPVECLTPTIDLLLTGMVLCNDAMLSCQVASDVSKALGDPTEVALGVAAARLGVQPPQRSQQFPRLYEFPFDPDRKSMTTVHGIALASTHRAGPQLADQSNNSSPPQTWLDQITAYTYLVFTKGAFTAVIDRCSQLWINGHIESLDSAWREQIRTLHQNLAATGVRVLMVAFRGLDQLPEPMTAAAIETDLVFVGIVGMVDPIRVEAKQAVEICQQAGIRPIMITGDHPLTAQHIAQELGIAHDQILTGQDLTQLTPAQLATQVQSVSIYARVSPHQKLSIVEALQNQGEVVAMTGDGVNDAPALKKADIGIAMGITGADVAKEAADMVLLDDNFATIVAAVQEGRVIYDNIRKFIKYSMTGNASGVAIMLIAPLLVMPLPLLPIQILWINLLADGLLALALSIEPAESNTMQRPPYRPNENLFGRGVGRDIFWIGGLLGLAILLLGYGYWYQGQANWQTMVFVTLAFSRMSLALAMRSSQDSWFSLALLGNPSMLAAVLLTLGLQLLVIYVPQLQAFFQTMPLSLSDLGIGLGVSTLGFWAIETEKWIVRQNLKP